MGEGMILNTRPADYRERFHAAFADMGWPIVDCPVLVTEIVGASVPAPTAFDALIFTSALAVKFFPVGPGWLDKLVYVVGPGTAAAAREAGFDRVIQTGADAADMSKFLAGASFGAALYISGEEVTADFSRERPGRITRVVLYRMAPRSVLPGEVVAALKHAKFVLVPIFSKRSGAVVADVLAKADFGKETAQVIAVGISRDAVPPGPWQDISVAAEPSLEGVVAATRAAIAKVKDA